jgi:hypothetical protein
MKNSSRLVIAFGLSILVHLGVVAYMNQKTLEPFGARPADARERPVRVAITRELPRSVTKPAEEMDHLIREERIHKLLEERTELPLEPPPEPEVETPENTVSQAEPPVEDAEELPTFEERSAEPEIDAIARTDVLQIPVPRVEPPQPDSRTWTQPNENPLPPLAALDSDPKRPAPPPLDAAPVKPSAAPLPTLDPVEIPLPAEPDSILLPDDILIEVPSFEETEESQLPEETYPVTNWDDFLEVEIDAYRPDESPGFFRITVKPNEKADILKAMAKDVLFAIDASGSIDEGVFNRLKRKVADSLEQLGPKDRFNVIGFKADVVALNRGLWNVRPETIDRAQEFILSLNASGKTDIYRSLTSLARALPPGDRPFLIVLFSDGMPTVGVKDSRELINLITVENKLRASIHVLGVGERKNRYLLELLAYRNKGTAKFVDNPDEIENEVSTLVKELSEPLLSDVVADLSGFSAKEATPAVLPDLFRNGSLRIYGRYDQERELTLRLAGTVRGRPKDFVFRGELPERETEHTAIARQWAASKSYDLVAENCAKGDSPERVAQIRDLVRAYELHIPSN